ncbi:hypothetical protein EVG20_g6971 [Dentipellis fragilis]|uniref:BTB domain-containing protein n=1 Tax=Dentipellis fragilis TaxID=205917 RepID=A0A4Y9YL39_9AGAM|nr:hypothetical protein EVG20_g6971 [Dentipellis fragilis]
MLMKPQSVDDVAKAEMLGFIGQMLRFVYDDSHTEDLVTIDHSIASLEQAATLSMNDDLEQGQYLHKLGKVLMDRSDLLSLEPDLAKAITMLERAVHLTPDSSNKKAVFLNNLSIAYRSENEHFGREEALRKARSASDRALGLSRHDIAQLPSILTTRANLFLRCFEQLAQMETLEEGINCLEEAVRLSSNAPDISYRLHDLSNLYFTCFKHSKDSSALQKAISATSEQALSLITDNSENKSEYLGTLGSLFLARFEQDGDVADLDRSISLGEQAAELSPKNWLENGYRLTALGSSFLRRFEWLGNIIDIDSSVSLLVRASNTLPEGRNKAICLNSLGQALLLRFGRLGDTKDLETSLLSFKQAIALISDMDAVKPGYLNNLSWALQVRFTCLWRIEDLDDCILSLNQAIALVSDDHPMKPGFLSNLGDSYLKRHNKLKDIEDLNHAIEISKRAVDLTPPGHARKPTRLLHLGKAYLKRFEDHTKECAYLNEAMWTLYEAVKLTPEGHPFKVDCLTWMGICTRNFFDAFRNVGGLDRAINAYQMAATSPTGEPSLLYAAAMLWAHAAHIRHGPSSQAIDAYSTAMDLVPRIAWLGRDIATRHKDLADKGEEVSEAAVTAIEKGDYDIALEWLEQGRSVVWGQLLNLHSLVDKLCGVNNDDEPLEDVAQHHRHLAEDWERIVEQVRALPGFGSFLRPKRITELRRAAFRGPVIFLNIHKYRCDALILPEMCHSDAILHVPLDQFSIKKALALQSWLRQALGASGMQVRGSMPAFSQSQGGPSFQKILSTLWLQIVKPILDKLNHKVSSSSTPPRIWWCATGPVAFLPLHAAGIYDTTTEPGSKVFDYVTSSYTPTLTALLNDMSKQEFRGLLAVSQPSTPGQKALPETVNEVRAIEKRVGCFNLEWLNGSQATVSSVLSGMAEHSWIHLACHAVQRVDQSTKSAFCLDQGQLELSQIITKSLPFAELAFLSACQTASGDEKLSEEAVHLVAGMLLAGYQSVIATMWSIRDSDAPLVADSVYSRLLADARPDSTASAHALHCTVEKLRRTVGEQSFVAWRPSPSTKSSPLPAAMSTACSRTTMTNFPVSHNGTVYFPDGNIVLMALRDPRTRVVFRMYKGVLASRSPVFEGMFSLPAQGTTEQYDGAPAVYMPDDANHLQLLLEVLYLGREVPSKRLSPDTPSDVWPILELCRKYQIDSLRNTIITRLEEDWPPSLDGWDVLDAQIQSMALIWTRDHRDALRKPTQTAEYFDTSVPEPASAIQLAREFDIPSILPAAFYTLSRISIDENWHIMHDLDERTSQPTRTARWRDLGPQDFICLLEGRARLQGVMDYDYSEPSSNLVDIYYDENPHARSSFCTESTRETFYDQIGDAASDSSDVLGALHPYQAKFHSGHKVCPSCSRKFTMEVHNLRQYIWDRLPEHFGLCEPASDSESM